jgi:hypothetical protein
MALPATVRVKLSSEAAGYAALTPVVAEEIPFRELAAHVARVCGKDAGRFDAILRRGSLVNGATRYRWEGLALSAGDLAEALALLPDPEPHRPFDAGRCVRAVLAGPGVRVEVQREAAAAPKMFHRTTFWRRLLEAAARPAYITYSYRERADCYRAPVTEPQKAEIRAAASLLKYAGLAAKIESARFEHVEFLVER